MSSRPFLVLLLSVIVIMDSIPYNKGYSDGLSYMHKNPYLNDSYEYNEYEKGYNYAIDCLSAEYENGQTY
jgi:hypothetical protein